MFNNENEETQFKTISVHDVIFVDEESETEKESTSNVMSKLPKPTIEGLDNDGVLTIKFDKKLKVPDEFKSIEDAEVALRFMKARTETYLTMDGYREFEIRPALELQIQPGEGKEVSSLNFTWEIIEFTASEVKIQLYFDIPEQLSENSVQADQIMVTFWANEFFVSEEGYYVK